MPMQTEQVFQHGRTRLTVIREQVKQEEYKVVVYDVNDYVVSTFQITAYSRYNAIMRALIQTDGTMEIGGVTVVPMRELLEEPF